ncbi:MAG: septum formation initiator family protein [Patescibacteria group bacterium]|nr:septum formation initiator family protein [Patescibacteria group bacterium]
MNKRKNISNFRQSRKSSTSSLSRYLAGPKVFAIIALIFLLLILVPLAKDYSRKRIIENEIIDIQNQISDFEDKNKDLKEMIDYFQSDASLEEQARLNLGLKRPGETVVVVTDEEANFFVDQPVAAPPIANWRKWLQYFIN